ncbi:spherulation-specific family 4 protein [Streptomyces sp. NBC_00091]|uniref:spherulation-specific family 4 protein n=1 Tax=Streptomyces sp. NBC_00091 TaxID=2975648 RepID=UPI0022547DDE|nr:spherulation-specific family 4 protein [Streptomyces sp. NBC_00091]MCX5379864.1 spherulation-specific family 4 protein [Streptomyces sp. NBC_00091]
MAPARALKALYAVALIGLLAAPAPAVPASARPAEKPAEKPAERPAGTPTVTPTPRIPGVRGLEIGVPAYVWADDPMLAALTATTPAASVVVLNPGNGDAPFDRPWRARADALRSGTTATGEKTKVLGYVHTDHGNRDLAAVKASVDNYLKTPDGRLHVDGIFFDVVSRDCGPANATRDRYAELRRYVQDVLHAADPDVADLVVNNPGTAIADCYLEPGHRTADVFVTYEDTHAAYTGGGWPGGNVFDALGGYRPGTELDPSGTAFWHLVHEVPDTTAMRTTLRTAFDRGAGYAYATSATMPNPWNTSPAWKYRPQTGYAATLGGADTAG